MPTLRELLADGRVHVADGAMGTMLYGRGVFLNVCYDELNLKQPDLVRDIHREYVRAGAELIETNTFGANPVKLATHGLAAETERINAAAAALAREAAGTRATVVGAIGPLGVRIEPFGEMSVAEARDAFARQVQGLLAGGVDGFILETFSDVAELGAAAAAVRALSDLPIIAQMTVGTDGKTHYGTDPIVFGPELASMGVDVIGVNCSVGPSRRPGGGREAGASRDHPHLGAAQRRTPARGRRSQDVHGVAGVYGQLRASDGGGRRAHRGRLLRNDS